MYGATNEYLYKKKNQIAYTGINICVVPCYTNYDLIYKYKYLYMTYSIIATSYTKMIIYVWCN